MAATPTPTATAPASVAASIASAATSAALNTAKVDVVTEYTQLKADAVAESKSKPWVFAAVAFVVGAVAGLEAVHYLHLAL
ncbi:MAG: hypothetical protein ACRDRT_12110 [Pseudonocardiaceae bacterium]